MDKSTTIWIKTSTKQKLDQFGKRKENYDAILNRLLANQSSIFKFDLAGRRLYRQGVEARPFLLSVPYSRGFKVFGENTSVAWNYGKKNYSYWDENIVTDLARVEIATHVRDGTYLQGRISKWLKIAKKQISFEKNITNLKKKTDEELLALIHKLSDYNAQSWDILLTIELFDPQSEKIIEEMLTKYDDTNLSVKEFKVLCSTERRTNIQKEISDLYTIAENEDYDKLAEHASKYFWISNSWGDTKYLDENFFRAKISRLTEERIDFKKEKTKMLDNIKQLIHQKKVILKDHDLCTEIKRTIGFFTVMTDWRETRKKYALITNHYLNILLGEFSRRTNVDKELLMFSQPHELKIPITLEVIKELRQRSIFCLQYLDEEGSKIVCSKEVRTYIESIELEDERRDGCIMGNVANPGKVEGVAKVIFTTDDICKMKDGDILVAPCTRPEYVSAMKKASAILTDEGGITSHAAIVSRELGVPCIVGLRNATDVIKDGDKISVNANHGIVYLAQK